MRARKELPACGSKSWQTLLCQNIVSMQPFPFFLLFWSWSYISAFGFCSILCWGKWRESSIAFQTLQPLVVAACSQAESYNAESTSVGWGIVEPVSGTRMYSDLGCPWMPEGPECTTSAHCKTCSFFPDSYLETNFFPRSHSKVSQDMIDNMLTAFMNGTFELYPVFIVCFVLYTLHNFFFGGKLNI